MVVVFGLPLFAIVPLVSSLFVLVVIIRRCFFHPLSSYPGPWLGKFSDLTAILAIFRRRRAFKQYELLQKYGSPVRMGTNTLLFSDMETFAQIYGQSSVPCLKDPEAYDGLSATGEVNVLNVTDRHQHARLRRLISHSFSVKSLLETEEFLTEKIDQYVSIFEGRDGQSVNILERTYELFLDIVSQLSFGESFDCLSGKTPTAHRDVQAFFMVVPAMAMAPILRYLPIKAFREGLKGLGRLQEFSRAHVAAYLARSAEKPNFGPKGRFLQNLALSVDAETGTKLTQEELVENAIIFLTAGSGTTAATVIYLIWECGRHPEDKEKLIDEIRARFPDPSVQPSYDEASRLPFLNCVIEEVLRLRGPLNSGAPRVSPGKVIGSKWVPEGTKVETSSYATARDPSVFPDPLRFKPSRWENATEEMRQMSRPFSYGPRNCVGRHLAEIGLVLTVTRLYQRYDVIPDLSIPAEDMRQLDFGVLEPACANFYVTPLKATK
ncbi:hypothetical protein LTR84_003742 [Exophiala bonariae]|uniref:Cytochrome P450 n=1 Tax=Exophiala bonariae TaxID=1690606 RepID=A0AAV9NAN1_9EURO|nr:hypothetical protein LTR84_003742 [Exophiala bonariae]